MKHILLVLPLAVLLFGCPEKEEPGCEPDSLPQDTCSAEELATVEVAGVWHGLGEDATGNRLVTVTSFHDPAAPKMEGRELDLVDFTERFFLRSATTSSGGRVEQRAFTGCRAPDPRTVQGNFQICVDGVERAKGTFEMKRIVRLAGEEEASGLTFEGEARVTQGTPLDVFVHNGYAYVASGAGGMNVFNVTDPAHPALEHQFNRSDSLGNADYFYDVWVHQDVLYVASRFNGLLYFDLAVSPIPSTELNRQPSPPEAIRSIYVDPVSNRLLANSIDSGHVLIFNVANPRSPVLLGRFAAADLGLSNYPHHSVLEGDRIYGAYGGLGLVAASIAQPGVPTQLGNAASPLEPARNSHALAAATFGTTPWVFEISEGWGGHVRALDFTTPTAPVPAGEYATRPEVSANQVDRVGNRLYLAYHQDGVRILDITNPAAPVLAGHFNAWSDTSATRGNFFYEGVTAVHAARDASGLVYALESERGLIVLREVL